MREDAARDSALFAEVMAALRPTAADGSPQLHDLAADTVPGYRLLEVVHRRGASVVYRAVDLDGGRMVALKLLLGEPWSSARARERFAREAELTQALAHDDIVPVLDSGAARGHSWLVRPWIAGEPLDQFVTRARPPRVAVLRLLLRVCRAVGGAHRHGVLHRDLKPANILVDASGAPRLLDFGSAKALPASHATATQEFVGTPAYASPEQVTGRPLTTASDVYALGVIACESLTGALPYRCDGDLSRLAASICHAEPCVEGLDVPLRAVLLRALEKDPDRRYAHADDLADDLERCIDGRPPVLPGLPRVYLLRRALRRHRRVLVAVAVGVVLAVAAGAFALRLHVRAETQTATAREVQELLREVIAAAQPDRMGGGVPLVDVLDEVARRLDSTLRTAPDVQAHVQLTLGDTYRRLHLLDRAENHLSLALARCREVRAPDASLAQTLLLLGTVQSERGHRAAAATLREALEAARRAWGTDSLEAARARGALGVAMLTTPFAPDARESRRHLDAAHAGLAAALGPDHHEVAVSRHRLACWEWREGSQAEAVRQLGEVASRLRAHEATDDGAAVACYTDLAAWLQATGRLDEAEVWLQRAASLTTRLFGERRTSDMLRRFARLHYARGDFATSEVFALRSLTAAVRASRPPGTPPDAPHPLEAELALGLDEPRGRAAVLASARLLRAHHGPGEYELATWLRGLSRLAAARGQSELRIELLREALEFRCRLFGADCPVRADCLRELADCLEQAGSPSDAAPLRGEAERIDGRRTAAAAGEPSRGTPR